MDSNNITQRLSASYRGPSLTDVEKAQKRQALLSGKWAQPSAQAATGALL